MRFGLQIVACVCVSLSVAACSSGPDLSNGSTGGTTASSGSGSGRTSGSSGTATSGGRSAGVSGNSGTSGGAATSSASSGGAATSSGTSGGGGALSLPAGDCFTFSTQAEQPYNTACGDLMALTGAMVDLQKGAGSSSLCLLSGTYASLSAVPSSYASCNWVEYLEGGGGLADQGLIILDSSGTHHYRMWISSNALPELDFSFAPID